MTLRAGNPPADAKLTEKIETELIFAETELLSRHPPADAELTEKNETELDWKD